MDIIIVADSLDSSQPLLHIAAKLGYRVLKLIGPNDEVAGYVKSMQPDVLIFISDELDRQALREMRSVGEKRPTPILVFTRDSKEESIDAAVKAGASAYVVDCADPERLGSLIGVAQARFREHSRMQKELTASKNALIERKYIEKAKGIIMKSKSLSEDQAYNAIRKLAMNKNKRIGDIAEQIISASEVLV